MNKTYDLTHLDIDLSTRCNLKCRFCHLQFFNPKKITDMTYEKFLLLEPIFESLKSITFFSKFEPLVCKDFLKIFNKISDYNIETYFSTNGILLNDRIINSITGRLKYLTVSITGFTDETYKKNMGINGFETIKKNLTKLNVLKKRKKTKFPILRISTVGMLDTIHELKLAIDFAKEFNAVEGVQLTSFKAYSENLVNLMPKNNPEYFTKTTKDVQAYAKKNNIKFVLQSGDLDDNSQKTLKLGHRYCDMPDYRLSLQPNGDVYPCPVSYNAIGNFFDTPILEIWKGERINLFRGKVNDINNMNEDCINCTHCRHRSTTNSETNDFSKAKKYVSEMERK